MKVSRNVAMLATAITVAVIATSLALALIVSNTSSPNLVSGRAAAGAGAAAAGKPSGPGLTGLAHGRSRLTRSRQGRSRSAQQTLVPNRDVGGRLLASSGIVVHYPPGAPQLPSVPASAYVIANANTGQVLAAKDPHGLYPPASTLKVLTAITMLPRLRPNSMLLATKLAASVEPNIIGVIPGHRYRAGDLFRALLMVSANDAAVTLAQGAGSYAKGLQLMNAEAHHLQAYDVVARTPNGLPAAGQVVSAYDEALIARRALAIPAFMRYDSTLAASFPISRHSQFAMTNQNSLLTQYRGGIGGKIGWTIAAEATYIGLARRHGVTLIVTVLHATALTEITSAEQLLDWGFAMDGKVRPVGVLVPPLPATRSATHTASRTHVAGNRRATAVTRAGLAVSDADHDGNHPAAQAPATRVAAPLSYALSGQAWLRRARLVAGNRSGLTG
jgi:D-alanyl-D-alanine carboxypeptidase (penicillin-binding protein 5/6)